LVQHRFAVPEGSLQISQAQFAICDEVASRQVSLPDNWRSDARSSQFCGRYTIHFDRVEALESLAILVPTYRFHLSARINDQLLGKSEHQRNQIVPFYAEIPQHLLAEENNTLELTLTSSPVGEGFFDSVVLGSSVQLNDLRKRMQFWRVWLPQMLAIVIAVFGVISLLMFLTDIKRREYFYFGLFSLAWVVHMTNLLWMDITIPTYLWTRIVFFAVVSFATFGCLFASEFLQNINHRRDKVLISIWFAWAVALFIVGQEQLLFVAQFLAIPYSMTLGFVAAGNFLRATNFWNLSSIAVLYLAQNLAIIVVGIHDVGLTLNIVDKSIVFYLHFVGPLLILSIGAHMLVRYVTLLRTEQRFSGALQAELATERVQLQSALARERSAIESSAAQRERDGLMRDLHDSLGARLVSLVHLSGEGSASGKAAQETLDELRFMTTPLRTKDGDITVLLANFREKRLQKLEDAGLAVYWRIEDIDSPPTWTAGESMDFLRLLDELLSNILKHGTGNQIKIELTDAPILLTISNPHGGRTVIGEKGVGLQSLALRSEKIGASFDYEITEDEFIARFTLRA